jgi:hypothetical protein
MHAGLLHADRADAGGEGTLGQVAIANHLASARGIAAVLVTVNPVSNLGLDGLGQQLLDALAENVGKDILSLGQWYDPNLSGRTIHGGVLRCRSGTSR